MHGGSHFEIPSLLSPVSMKGNWLLPLTFGTNPIFNPDDLVMTVYTTHLVFLLGRDPSFAPLSFSFGLRSQKMLRKGQERLGKCYSSVSIPNFKSIISKIWTPTLHFGINTNLKIQDYFRKFYTTTRPRVPEFGMYPPLDAASHTTIIPDASTTTIGPSTTTSQQRSTNCAS